MSTNKKFDSYKPYVTRVGVTDVVDRASDGAATEDDINILKTEFTQPDIWHKADEDGMFIPSGSDYQITYKYGDEILKTETVSPDKEGHYAIQEADITAFTKSESGAEFSFSAWKIGDTAVVAGQVIDADAEFSAGAVAGTVTVGLEAGAGAALKDGASSVIDLSCDSYGCIITADQISSIKDRFEPLSGFHFTDDSFTTDGQVLAAGMEFKTGFIVVAAASADPEDEEAAE